MEKVNHMPKDLLDKLIVSTGSTLSPDNIASPDPDLARLKELDLRRHLTQFEKIEFDDKGKAICPVHSEENPSFEVKRHKNGHWYWFDWHNQEKNDYFGTIIDYYVQIKGMTVAEAIRTIRERENIQGASPPTRADFQPPVVEMIDPVEFLKTGAELQALDIQVKWTIDRILPARSLTLLYGPSGIGKTWLSLMMARAASLGEPIFGRTTIQRPVVYIDYENPLPVLVNRVRILGVRDVKFWPLSAVKSPPKLDSPEWTWLKRLPQGSIFIFDTARSCHNMDENSSEASALVMGRLKELRELDHDILLLHHTTKVDDQNAKGSTGWYDLADHTLSFCHVKRNSLEKEDNRGELDSGALLSLGVGKKTRFEPMSRLFLKFNPEEGFVQAEGPDDSDINALADYIFGAGHGKNQSEIINWAKENNVGSRNRSAFINLLNRFDGIRWRSYKGERGSKIYEPIS